LTSSRVSWWNLNLCKVNNYTEIDIIVKIKPTLFTQGWELIFDFKLYKSKKTYLLLSQNDLSDFSGLGIKCSSSCYPQKQLCSYYGFRSPYIYMY
jgi:hypothetical protein